MSTLSRAPSLRSQYEDYRSPLLCHSWVLRHRCDYGMCSGLADGHCDSAAYGAYKFSNSAADNSNCYNSAATTPTATTPTAIPGPSVYVEDDSGPGILVYPANAMGPINSTMAIGSRARDGGDICFLAVLNLGLSRMDS